jgi:hypothetical protein
VKNLIPSFGGKLVEAEEQVSLWPIVSLDGKSTDSDLLPHRIVTRAELWDYYICTQGIVDGQAQTCYSLRGGGGWYVLGYNANVR